MHNSAPEFSRLVPLARLGPGSFRQRIEATMEERQRLVDRFDLLSLDRLVAEVGLQRQSSGVILLEAAIEAEFEQCCVVTLDPVPGALCHRFSLVYGPAPEDEQEIAVSEDEPAFEPLAGDAIDIGEAVAQELSLALPEFPRQPDAAIDELDPPAAIESPFVSLANLSKRQEC